MGWILIQLADDEVSIAATKLLLETGEDTFDLTRGVVQLRPTDFGSHSWTLQESKYHSFIGEAACGRWAIGQNRKYLRGTHFYWMCDCKAMRDVMDYDGPISMMCCWAQELLGYQFSCLYRAACMMIDVDGPSRRFGVDMARHLCIAALLHKIDIANRPNAYNSSIGHIKNVA